MFNYPKFYSRVVDREGRILLEAVPIQRQILRPQAAYILTDMMRDVVTHGTGTHTRLRNTDIPVSGKTGTTTNTHDLMFSGYTPYFAASIWMGYDQPETLRTSTHHMLLWREVMEGIHADLEFRDFVQPSGIIHGRFCGISGQRPVPGRCRQIVTDLFIISDGTNESCIVCTQSDFRPLLTPPAGYEYDETDGDDGDDASAGDTVNGGDTTDYSGTGSNDDETTQQPTTPDEPDDSVTQPPQDPEDDTRPPQGIPDDDITQPPPQVPDDDTVPPQGIPDDNIVPPPPPPQVPDNDFEVPPWLHVR